MGSAKGRPASAWARCVELWTSPQRKGLRCQLSLLFVGCVGVVCCRASSSWEWAVAPRAPALRSGRRRRVAFVVVVVLVV